MRRLFLVAVAAFSLSGPARAAPGDRALEDVRILSADDMGGRGIETAGGAKARAYIAGRFAELGLKVVEQPFTFVRKRDGKEVHGVNLIVRVQGEQPAGQVIVVTAHYDHLGTRDGVIYNGADDNASGVAGLLAVAENLSLAQPRHTIILVALDGEESGLRGARAFIEAPPAPLETIALNVNFDMLAKNAKGELYAAGGSTQPWVKTLLEIMVPNAPVSLKLGHDTGPLDSFDNWTMQSDHGSFAKAGIAWVYFGVEDHPEYHKPTDDLATIPQDFFRKAVDTVVYAVRVFDNQLDTLPARTK